MTELQLSEEQQAAFDQIYAYGRRRTRDEKVILLTGYAGTGKTTLVSALVNQFKADGTKVLISAPTHKAVDVLRRSKIPGVTYCTIHKLLGVKPQINTANGTMSFVADTWNKEMGLESNAVLFVDEVSMLDDELYDKLIDEVPERVKIIFVGDVAQIPPVSKSISKKPGKHSLAKVFNHEVQQADGIHSCLLSTVRRQALDSPILAYATEVRSLDPTNPEFRTENKLERLLPEHTENTLRMWFTSPKFKANADYAKVIAWTNAVTDQFNERIRSIMYGVNAPDYVIGEKLVMEEPYSLQTGAVLLQNNQELEIVELSSFDKKVDKLVWNGRDYDVEPVSFATYSAVVEYQDSSFTKKRMTIHILKEEERVRWNMMMTNMYSLILKSPFSMRKNFWKTYYSTKGSFAWVNYNYAITAHKSQGSTYENVIVCIGDMLKNPRIFERNSIIYVAVTRAKENCLLIY